MFGLIAAVGNQVATSNMGPHHHLTTAAAINEFSNKRNRRHDNNNQFQVKGRLHTKTGYQLRVNNEGLVTGVTRPDPFAMLIMVYTYLSIDSDNMKVNIKGFESGNYICMNEDGDVYGTKIFNKEECEYDVKSHHGLAIIQEYTSRTFPRKKHKKWSLGIHRSGKLLKRVRTKIHSRRSTQMIFESMEKPKDHHLPPGGPLGGLNFDQIVTDGGYDTTIETIKKGDDIFKRVIIDEKIDTTSTVDPPTTTTRRRKNKCNSALDCRRKRRRKSRKNSKDKFINSMFNIVLKSKRRHRRSLASEMPSDKSSILSKVLSNKHRHISQLESLQQRKQLAEQNSKT